MKENIQLQKQHAKPEGSIKIELFDKETGELVSETKKKNYVQERVLRAYAAAYAHMGLTADANNPLRTYEYARNVYLTDYAGATNPAAENFSEGNLIGFGRKGQSAFGTLRGAWNQVESVGRPDYLKLVYDFATSQGNGTFQSIYTNAGAVDNMVLNQEPYRIGEFLLPFSYSSMQLVGDKVYFFDFPKNAMYIVDKLDILLSTSSVSDILYTEKKMKTGAYMGAVRGDSFYFRVTNSAVIEKAPLTDPTASTPFKTLPETPARFGYNPKTDRFIVFAAGQIRQYDASMNLLNAVNASYSANSSRHMTITKDGKKAGIGNEIHDIQTGASYPVQTNHFTQSTTSIYGLLELGDYSLFLPSGSETNLVTFGTAPAFFSRVLLDSPVTKTSQQNMKITYEFNIPKFNIPIV